jgi:hypothetical protein
VHARVRRVAEEFLCPELLTATQYAQLLGRAELKILHQEDLTRNVIPTWEICLQRANAGKALLKVLPPKAVRFVHAMEGILEAYRAGDLHYTVLVAQRPA